MARYIQVNFKNLLLMKYLQPIFPILLLSKLFTEVLRDILMIFYTRRGFNDFKKMSDFIASYFSIKSSRKHLSLSKNRQAFSVSLFLSS